MKLKYVITGIGHSGTGYVSQALTANGFLCGHETLFGLDLNAEYYNLLDADSSWLAAGYLNEKACEAIKIIHLVRNPLDVLRSNIATRDLSGNSPYRKFLEHHIGIGVPEHYNIAEKTMFEYVEWNEKVRALKPIYLHRIENNIDELFSFLGISRIVNWHNPNYNKHVEPGPFCLDDLPVGELRDKVAVMGRAWGYDF